MVAVGSSKYARARSPQCKHAYTERARMPPKMCVWFMPAIHTHRLTHRGGAWWRKHPNMRIRFAKPTRCWAPQSHGLHVVGFHASVYPLHGIRLSRPLFLSFSLCAQFQCNYVPASRSTRANGAEIRRHDSHPQAGRMCVVLRCKLASNPPTYIRRATRNPQCARSFQWTDNARRHLHRHNTAATTVGMTENTQTNWMRSQLQVLRRNNSLSASPQSTKKIYAVAVSVLSDIR